MNTSELKQKIQEKYIECLLKGHKILSLERDNLEFRFNWSLSGKVAGRYTKNGAHEFGVNLDLANDNLEEYLNDTIPHEVSHYLAIKKFNDFDHDSGWRYTMWHVFHIVPRKYHDYDLISVGYHHYKCLNCGKGIQISPTIHNKIAKGQRRISNCCHASIQEVI